MNLKEYVYQKRISVSEFARQINYVPNYLISVSSGSIKPGAQLIKIIEKVTEGAVTKNEMMNVYHLKKASKE